MRMLFSILVAILLPLTAVAFEPNPGNRAYPVLGTDLVSGETVSLDALLGKWVMLELWSST